LYARVRLAKQREVLDFLKHRGLVPNSYDRIIDGGVCGLLRPDLVFDACSKVVIIEVDENQHQSSNYSDCDPVIRMKNVCSSFGGLPTVFIRWNPDSFKMEGQLQEVQRSKRLEVLEAWLRHFMDPQTVVSDLLSVMYLYYTDRNNDLQVLWRYDEASSSSS
jgi:hypothetical protein